MEQSAYSLFNAHEHLTNYTLAYLAHVFVRILYEVLRSSSLAFYVPGLLGNTGMGAQALDTSLNVCTEMQLDVVAAVLRILRLLNLYKGVLLRKECLVFVIRKVSNEEYYSSEWE